MSGQIQRRLFSAQRSYKLRRHGFDRFYVAWHPRRQRVGIFLTSEGVPELRVPYYFPDAEALGILEQHVDWLAAARERLLERQPVAPEDEEEAHQMIVESRQIVRDFLRSWSGPKPQRLTLRFMQSRWGSCSANGNISINASLSRLPLRLAHYVLVHELCHLEEMNHSPDFWALVEEHIPDWRERREELKRYHFG